MPATIGARARPSKCEIISYLLDHLDYIWQWLAGSKVIIINYKLAINCAPRKWRCVCWLAGFNEGAAYVCVCVCLLVRYAPVFQLGRGARAHMFSIMFCVSGINWQAKVIYISHRQPPHPCLDTLRPTWAACITDVHEYITWLQHNSN